MTHYKVIKSLKSAGGTYNEDKPPRYKIYNKMQTVSGILVNNRYYYRNIVIIEDLDRNYYVVPFFGATPIPVKDLKAGEQIIDKYISTLPNLNKTNEA